MFAFSESKQLELAAVVLLKKIADTAFRLPAMLEGEDKDLESLLEWMMTQGLIRVDKAYDPTVKGQNLLARYQEKYREFLQVYDVFCAVDLETGDFAFASYFKMDGADWQAYLGLDRWDDLRIAVAEYKGIDVTEIVFFDFLRNQRFETTKRGWQFDLVLGSLWEQLLEVCNQALTIEDLGYQGDEGFVSGVEVIRDVIRQGVELNIELKKTEAELIRRGEIRHPGPAPDLAEMERYLDPDYKSALWN